MWFTLSAALLLYTWSESETESQAVCNLRLRWWKVCSCSIDARAFGNQVRYINLCPVRENSLWQSFLSLLVIDSDLGELLLVFFSPELCLSSIANMVGYDSVWFVMAWFLVCGWFSLGFELLRWLVGFCWFAWSFVLLLRSLAYAFVWQIQFSFFSRYGKPPVRESSS